MTQFTLKYEPKQIKHAIMLLRVYNPGPYAAQTDEEVERDIANHIVHVFRRHDWDDITSTFSATGGYWLNFNRYVAAHCDPLQVECTVLIDPYIMIHDLNLLDVDPVFVLGYSEDQEGF